jgi:hypothetical protein
MSENELRPESSGPGPLASFASGVWGRRLIMLGQLAAAVLMLVNLLALAEMGVALATLPADKPAPPLQAVAMGALLGLAQAVFYFAAILAMERVKPR